MVPCNTNWPLHNGFAFSSTLTGFPGICPALYRASRIVAGTQERVDQALWWKAHAAMFLYFTYRSNTESLYRSVLWVKHINKDACSNFLGFYPPVLPSHRKELPFRETDLPKGEVKKASWIKALPAVFIFHPFFVPIGYGTQRLAP